MNKFYNALLFVVFMPTLLLSIVVGFDTPLAILNTSGANLSYHKEALLLVGAFILIINLRRSIRRWIAMRLVNQLPKYKWNTLVSKERVQRIYAYNFLEAAVFTVAGMALFTLTNHAWLCLVGMVFGALDAIVFVIYGSKANKFRVGLTSKALLAADRDVSIIYFKGLRRVSIQQQTVFFDFKDELQHRFPLNLIPEDKREEFFHELKENTDESKVYFQNNI